MDAGSKQPLPSVTTASGLAAPSYSCSAANMTLSLTNVRRLRVILPRALFEGAGEGLAGQR